MSEKIPPNTPWVAISKRQNQHAIQTLYELGHRDFGENYVQEWQIKQKALPTDIRWHFIGTLQSNKTRFIAEHADGVHALTQVRIAHRLQDQRPAALPPLKVWIAINLAQESNKTGLKPEVNEALLTLTEEILQLPHLHLMGLMGHPPVTLEFAQQQAWGFQLSALQQELKTYFPARQGVLNTLSFGTSHDFEAALQVGPTCLRLGEVVFGPRPLS